MQIMKNLNRKNKRDGIPTYNSSAYIYTYVYTFFFKINNTVKYTTIISNINTGLFLNFYSHNCTFLNFYFTSNFLKMFYTGLPKNVCLNVYCILLNLKLLFFYSISYFVPNKGYFDFVMNMYAVD